MPTLHTYDLSAPIGIGENARHFVDAAGTPFFWLGDTAWPLYTTYEKEDAEAYLTRRAQQGFTVIQGVLAWGDPEPEVGLEGRPPGTNYAGHHPWIEGDPARPNPAFFEHVDHLLDVAARLGLVMGILPTWGYHVQNSKVVTEANAAVYGRWLGERYRDRPNLIWINGGDREPLGFEPVWRALAHGLRRGDGGAHLITYHPCGWRSSSFYFQDDDWLDFNMIETWSAWPQVYAAVHADTCLQPIRPVVLGEPAYEDGPEYPLGPITPPVVRRQAWWTLMAGGFFTYGQNQMWRMEPGWTDTFDTPGALAMSAFRAIAELRPWASMIPDQGFFAEDTASAGRTLNTAMRTRDRTGAMLYLSTQCHVLLYLDRIAAPRVRATWFDPRDGTMLDGGEYDTGSAGPGQSFYRWTKRWFAVPDFWEDAVLFLDAID